MNSNQRVKVLSQTIDVQAKGTSSKKQEDVSIVLADGSQMTSELLAGALRRTRSFRVLNAVSTAESVLAAMAASNPQIGLLSEHLADGPYSGFKVLRKLRDLDLRTRYILMVDQVERDLVVDAFRAGARGIFRKSTPMRLLFRCITAVNEGQIWASSNELQYVIEALRTALPMRCANARGEDLLSSRERQVIPMVAEGLSNKEIAQKLSISEHTIKNHLFRIYEKLGISSRVELVLYAVARETSADAA